ncbi:MAG: hypothetical protein F4X17_23110 [Gemmatimonadetes bacterium]|nr:hypothetical protein [Gemmatimonadota bacterium]
MTVTAVFGLRAAFYEQLHCRYQRHQFDNWQVWGGNVTIEIDGRVCGPPLARAYIEPNKTAAIARVRCELFVAAVDPREVQPGDVDARLWTDANGTNDYVEMRLLVDAEGVPVLAGNNLVFESETFALERTGTFNYAVEFSADSYAEAGRKEWISLNDLAENRDGVVVVSPEWVRKGPTVAEVCVRKVGAEIEVEGGRFRSGRLVELTRRLEDIPADVIYLLPFFRPGFADLHTGADVRKGALGSVYAAQDFFQIDPELVSPIEEVDWRSLVAEGFVLPDEMEGLAGLSAAQVEKALGRDAFVQLVGRAQLRALTRRAHALDKKVIFDLVLMQSSRDCPLIAEHPEWYLRDERGVPQIHQIAWLVYSDVALFDLVYNQPLQEYLLEIAPYWIEQCGFDGVRIDASQTIDRPFLKKLKNRIQAVSPEALVLGETLCPLTEAVDVPADAIYALLVDFHRDTEHAHPLIDFLEEMNRTFAPGTVAMAYFENHDSPRATQVWHERFHELLQCDEQARDYWQGLTCPIQSDAGNRALLMALLKNLQAALIDCSAGSASKCNLTRGLELGSEWGEETRTDFENETLLHFDWAEREPHASLARAYECLFALQKEWPEFCDGEVYFHRNEFAGGDPDDRILAYVRYTERSALLVSHNFDPHTARRAFYHFDYLPQPPTSRQKCFDTYEALAIEAIPASDEISEVSLMPLQTQVWRLY